LTKKTSVIGIQQILDEKNTFRRDSAEFLEMKNIILSPKKTFASKNARDLESKKYRKRNKYLNGAKKLLDDKSQFKWRPANVGREIHL
jgi:hypothetical protein